MDPYLTSFKILLIKILPILLLNIFLLMLLQEVYPKDEGHILVYHLSFYHEDPGTRREAKAHFHFSLDPHQWHAVYP